MENEIKPFGWEKAWVESMPSDVEELEMARQTYLREERMYDADASIESLEQSRRKQSSEKVDPLVARARVIREQYSVAKKYKEHIGLKELRGLARELRKLGVGVPKYSGMSSPRLYRVIEQIVGEILDN